MRSDHGACRRSLKRQGLRNEDGSVDAGSQIDAQSKGGGETTSFACPARTPIQPRVPNAISISYETALIWNNRIWVTRRSRLESLILSHSLLQPRLLYSSPARSCLLGWQRLHDKVGSVKVNVVRLSRNSRELLRYAVYLDDTSSILCLELR